MVQKLENGKMTAERPTSSVDSGLDRRELLRAVKEKHESDLRLNPSVSKDMKNIVRIGGAAGVTVMEGLTQNPAYAEIVWPTAIVTPFDNGGNSGEFVKNHKTQSPGDKRRLLVAQTMLSRSNPWRKLFNARHPKDGTRFADVVLGNYILSEAERLYGRQGATKLLAELLNIHGEVLPVSNEDAVLVATLSDGRELRGETLIDCRDPKDKVYITGLRLEPPVLADMRALQAIIEAHMIVLGPGDLYSSLLACLLVEGVIDAINSSSGMLVFIVNLMTKPAETRGYDVGDFVQVLRQYGIKRPFTLLVHHGSLPPALRQRYRRVGSTRVMLTTAAKNKIEGLVETVVTTDLVDERAFAEGFVHHHPDKVAAALMSLFPEAPT